MKDCTVIEQHDLMLQIQELLREHSAKTAAVESMEMTLRFSPSFSVQLGKLVRLDYSDTLSRVIYACRTVKSRRRSTKFAGRSVLQKLPGGNAELYPCWRFGTGHHAAAQPAVLQRWKTVQKGSLSPTIALTGSATSMPHGVPCAQRIVQSGDFVLMDYGAMVDGYHSDMTRTVCVGQPSEKECVQVYDIVVSGTGGLCG